MCGGGKCSSWPASSCEAERGQRPASPTVTRAGECSGVSEPSPSRVTCRVHLPGPPAASARRSALRTPARDTPRGPGPAHESYPEPSRSCPQPGTPPAPRSPRPGQDASPSPRPVNLALRPKVKVELRRGSEGARGQGNRQARVFPDRGAKGERAQGAS